MARINIPQQIFEEAVKGSGGIISAIQEKLATKGFKMGRSKLIEKIKERPSIVKLLEEERERVKDRAEANVLRAVAEGDIKVSIEYLKQQAQERGWSIDKSLNLKGLGGLKIQISAVKKTNNPGR